MGKARSKGSLFDEHWRAFWLPVLGVVAIFLLVWMSWDKDVNQTSVAAGIAAITTLVASAAGHAAGAAKAADDASGGRVRGDTDLTPPTVTAGITAQTQVDDGQPTAKRWFRSNRDRRNP